MKEAENEEQRRISYDGSVGEDGGQEKMDTDEDQQEDREEGSSNEESNAGGSERGVRVGRGKEAEVMMEKGRSEGGEVELCITVPSMDDPDSNEKKILHISYIEGLYPRQFPKVFLSGGWKEGCGTMFHIGLVKFLSSLSEGEPMVFELFGRVQEMLAETNEQEPSMESILITHLEGGKEYLAAHAPSKQAVNKTSTKSGKKSTGKELKNGTAYNIRRRPREKSFFWSKRPNQTPNAVAFPKISTLMKTTRDRLPAAKARDEFLSVMKMADKDNRVVLVTGGE